MLSKSVHPIYPGSGNRAAPRPAGPGEYSARRRLPARSACVLALAAFLSACAVTPEPATDQERTARATEDMSKLFVGQEPIRKPISLYEAIARALKYNLDQRLKIMERALADGQLDVNEYSLLPRLAASAGYSRRSNERGSNSRSLITGEESLEVSTSEDQGVTTGSLSLSWNILDFGMSYFRAKQSAEEALISEERRRKVVQNIMLDVRDAYWRAVSAESLLPPLRKLIGQIEDALSRSRTADARRLVPPRQALTFQRDLLDQLRELNLIRRRLVLAKISLAALINLRPGEDFALEIPNKLDIVSQPIKTPVEKLEMIALIDRPEIREEDYRKRISQIDVHRAMLSLIPGIEFQVGGDYDSNSFLAHNTWASYGATITQNLFSYLSAPTRIKFAKTALKVADARRLALSMAIVAQVQIAYRRYIITREEEMLAQRILLVDERMTSVVNDENKAAAVDELELIRNQTNVMVSSLRRDIAIADVQNAYGRLVNSIGADPLPAEIEKTDLATLTRLIRASLNAWDLRIDEVLEGRKTPIPIKVPDRTFWQIDGQPAPSAGS